MIEKRSHPRYPVRLKCYFPDLDMWGEVRNVSVEGCFICAERPLAVGMVTDLLVELPVVGVVHLIAYIQHHTKRAVGAAGLQLMGARFDKESSGMYMIYRRFVESLEALVPLKVPYEELITGETKAKIAPFIDDNCRFILDAGE